MKNSYFLLNLFIFLLFNVLFGADFPQWVTFRYLAPKGTKSVQLAGNFNDWSSSATPMTKTNGFWEARLQLDIGQYEYRFLVDGKHWMRDPLNPEFGGPHSNSLLHVKPAEQPGISSVYPAPGSVVHQSDFTVSAKFEPGASDADIDLTKSRLSLDEKRFPLEITQMPHHVSAFVRNIPEGIHSLNIELVDAAGYATEKVTHIFVVNAQNLPPVAHAGFTQIVAVNQKFLLNGGLSFDPDLDPIRHFNWKCAGVPGVCGVDSLLDSPFPEISLPVEGCYHFSLQVSAGGLKSQTDTVSVYAFNRQSKLTEFSFHEKNFPVPVVNVNLAGEFNRWQPTQTALLKISDSLWQIQLPLENGEYEYKFVVNESNWIPDPVNPFRVADGWQGVNSVKSVRFPEIPLASVEIGSDGNLQLKSVSEKDANHFSLKWISERDGSFKFTTETGKFQILPKVLPPGQFLFQIIQRSSTDFSVPQNYFLDSNADSLSLVNWSASPDWCRDAIIYEIFVRKFTEIGNLEGVRQKLDYLHDLGINCIWLMPVFESPTDHGYGPTHFFQIEKDYGTLEDFRKLVQEAHQKGIRVVLDFIANHTSDQHPYFRAALQNSKSIFRNWYIWRDDTLRADGPIYEYYNDWDTLPNLNFENPQVWKFMLAVARFWLSEGVDGFRCDVAWGVPHLFWKTFRHEVKQINSHCLLLNEVLPRSPAYHREEFDMSYDTDFYGNLLDVLKGKKDVAALDYGLCKTFQNYPPIAQNLRYLENHDMDRFIDQFGPSRTRLAAALLFTYPGTPLLLYGQEIGLTEKTGNMRWAGEPPELMHFYRMLIQLRRAHPALRSDEIFRIPVENPQLYAYWRRVPGDNLLILLNFSDEFVSTILDLPSEFIKIDSQQPCRMVEVLSKTTRHLATNQLEVQLSPFQPAIFSIE